MSKSDDQTIKLCRFNIGNSSIIVLFIYILTPFMTADISGGGAFSLDFPKIRFILLSG